MIPLTPPEEITALGPTYARLWYALPEYVSRAEVSKHISVYSPRSLANLDCRGQGPPGRLVIAGRVCYPRDQLVIWFAGLARSPKTRKRPPIEISSSASNNNLNQ